MAKANRNDKPVEVTNVEPERFDIDDHRKNCIRLYGVTTSTFDGACFDMQGMYSIEEVKDKIAKWLKKEVKN